MLSRYIGWFSPVLLFPDSKPESSLAEKIGVEEPKESVSVKLQGKWNTILEVKSEPGNNRL